MIVALVEDDATVLSLLAELLRGHGHDPREVLIAVGDTVPGSLDRIAEHGAPVVMLDLSMPVNGLHILEAAQADARFSSVRWLIATASFDGAAHAPKSPSIRAVAKPYEIPDLLAAIEGRT